MKLWCNQFINNIISDSASLNNNVSTVLLNFCHLINANWYYKSNVKMYFAWIKTTVQNEMNLNSFCVPISSLQLIIVWHSMHKRFFIRSV